MNSAWKPMRIPGSTSKKSRKDPEERLLCQPKSVFIQLKIEAYSKIVKGRAPPTTPSRSTGTKLSHSMKVQRQP
ncbi:hypothetical protein CR513_01940, partial [Mucuna pruriens]